MSAYLSARHAHLTPYVPGEQPQDRSYIKLNTNESPFPPSPGVLAAVSGEVGSLQLYSDPCSAKLVNKLAQVYGVKSDQVIVGNGSDEILGFAFYAFADEKRPMAFPDVTYGFYRVLCGLYGIPYAQIPLREDFSIAEQDYIGLNKTIALANPNAPTGKYLPLGVIERIVRGNPDSVVIVDEAYIDFGGESAACLIDQYDNLLVARTFSKSRSMAGARLGFALGNARLIADLNAIRCAGNPYNVNRLTAEAGYAALCEDEYYMENCRRIAQTREETARALQALGFEVLPSLTNFVFARTPEMDGQALYLALKARGILVRHFDGARVGAYNRITIGTQQQMQSLLTAISQILEENRHEKH